MRETLLIQCVLACFMAWHTSVMGIVVDVSARGHFLRGNKKGAEAPFTN